MTTTMRVAAALAATLAAAPMPAGAAPEEPSEAVMRELVETLMNQRLSGQVAAVMMGVTVQVTRLEKGACAPAAGKPGVVCGYRLTMTCDQRGGGSFLCLAIPTDAFGEARFHRVGEAWVITVGGT